MLIIESVKLQPGNPYMLRNDGELLTCDDVHPYIRYNHVSPDEALEGIISNPRSLKWFYDNTADPELKNNIEIVVNSTPQLDNSDYDITDKTYKTHNRDEMVEFLEEVSVMSNQEFLRLRMSDLLYGGITKDLYARISSLHFDWYPLLWNIVQENNVSDITVIKDSNTFGGRFEPYKVKGQSIYRMPKDEFLTLSGNPVLESYKSKYDVNNYANQLLYEGKSYRDAYYGLRPRYAKGFYNKDIQEGLEFDIDNILVSKDSIVFD